MKILEAFEWRRDVAQEALDTEGVKKIFKSCFKKIKKSFFCNRKSLSIKPRKTRIKYQLEVLIKSNNSLLKYLFVNFV
jgi:hypothetical protein